MLEAIMSPPSMQSSLMNPKHAGSNDKALLSKPQEVMQQENSLFIIDWDDTLLATSWLSSQGLRLDATEIPEFVAEELRALESSIYSLLAYVLTMGKVAIVTNAESSWVELSARKFVPAVCDLLPQIRVLSARSSYQDMYPNQVPKWKIEAYKCVFQEAFPELSFSQYSKVQNRVQVLSLGDSVYERDALMELASHVGAEKLLPKSVKFVERPNPGQLVQQIAIVLDNLFDVYSSTDGVVDLMLQVEYL